MCNNSSTVAGITNHCYGESYQKSASVSKVENEGYLCHISFHN